MDSLLISNYKNLLTSDLRMYLMFKVTDRSRVMFVLRSGTNSTPEEQGMLLKLVLSTNFVSCLKILTKSLGDEMRKMAKGEIL